MWPALGGVSPRTQLSLAAPVSEGVVGRSGHSRQEARLGHRSTPSADPWIRLSQGLRAHDSSGGSWLVSCVLYGSSPQPFRPLGPVSWKTIFPQTCWVGWREVELRW